MRPSSYAYGNSGLQNPSDYPVLEEAFEFSTFPAAFTEQRAESHHSAYAYATYTTTDVTPVEGAADTLSSGSSSRIGGDGAVEVEAAPAVGAIASAVQLLPAGTLTIWPGWP